MQAKKTEQQAKETHNLLWRILPFVGDSYLFSASYVYVKLWRAKINTRYNMYEYDKWFKF